MRVKLINIPILALIFVLYCKSEEVIVKPEPVVPQVSQEEIQKAEDELKKKQKIENFKIIAENIKSTEIFNTDENYKDFIFAFFNNKENKEFNSVTFEGDEFDFNSSKNKLSEIRRSKYFYFTGNEFDISEYDFSKKGFYIKVYESSIASPSTWGNEYGYKYNRFESNKIFLSISEDEAKGFKNNNKEFQGVFILKTSIEKDKVFKCKIIGSQDIIYNLTIGKNEINAFTEENTKWSPECRELSISVKKINASIIKLIISDLVTKKNYIVKKDK